MLFHRELEANLQVCRNCGHHFRIGAEQRLKMLFDDGAFTRIELPKTMVDPLRFRDRKRYTDRLREAQAALGPGSDAVVVAQGRIGGMPAVVAAFEFAVHGRLDGDGGRRGAGRRRQARRAAGGGADRRAGLGRRAHAGGHPVVDADAAHDHRRRHGQGGGAALHRGADRSDDRRRLRLVRDGRRHHPRRARRDHRLCRRPGHRGDDPREAAGGVSARRIPARARHGRSGRAARRAARDLGAHPRAVARPAAAGCTAAASGPEAA